MATSFFPSLVEEGAQPRSFARDACLCSPDRPANQLYVLADGYVRESSILGGREIIHDLRSTGDLVGELAFWNHSERAWVKALTPVRAWPVDLYRFREHVSANAEAATAVLHELFARNVTARRHEALARASVAERLAVCLLNLEHRYGLASPHPPPLTQETLAAMVGSSPDVVGRLVGGLLRKGTLTRTGYGKLRVDDPAGLVRAAGPWAHLAQPWTGRIAPLFTSGRPAAEPLPSGDVPRPAQLPADVHDFTGRQQSLEQLTSWLRRPRRTNTMVIQGLPGVGKTALATHWAHLYAADFPDGQIVVDLRGQSPSQPPMSTAEALGQILRSLGVGEQMPAADEAELMLLYRTRIAGRRLLLLLDNAADPSQVLPLLPGSRDCVVLVTSRTRMAPLRATGAADLMDLAVLDPGNAVTLLATMLGDDPRVSGERDALAELAKICSHHPFALRISAARLAENPALTVASRVRELRRPRPRMTLAGDPEAAFGSTLELAYESLEEEQRRAFRHIGLLPGRDFAPDMLAIALGLPVRETLAALDGLHRACLVEPLPSARYRIHDLVKRLARELGRQSEPGAREARVRLLAHYLAVVRDPATPQSWFEAERRSLVTIVRMAWESAAHGTAWQLAAAVFEPFRVLRYYENNLEIQRLGLESAHQMGDRWAIALIRSRLGAIHRDIGPSTEAARFIGAALADYTELGDREGRARALNDLAEVYGIAGNGDEALACATESLEAYRKIGDRAGIAGCLHTISRLHLAQGEHELAAYHAGQALAVREAIGDRRGGAQSLIILARVLHRLGESQAALSHGLDSLAICHELGDRHSEAETLLCLAEIYDSLGLREEAQRDAEEALSGYTAMGDQHGMGRALGTLGQVARNRSHYDEAIAHYAQALTIQQALRHRQGEAETLGDIGFVHWRRADYLQATDLLNQALAISREIHDRPGETKMLNRLARVRRRLGQPEVAFVYAVEALDIAQDTGDQRAEADVQETLAHTYLGLGRASDASRAARRSVALREELRDIRASSTLALALHAEGDVRGALDAAREAVGRLNENGTRDRWGAAQTTLAMILLDLGRLEEARIYAEQARQVHVECGTRRDLGCALRALGLIAREQGAAAEAVERLTEAVRIFSEVGDFFELRAANGELREMS